MFKPKVSECNKKAKEYIVASSGCANDDAAVAALPNQWVPRHGGATLAKYLNEREQNHVKTLQNIASGAEAINISINDKIRVLSEHLLGQIQQTSKDMECLVLDTDMCSSTLVNSVREKALKKIYQLNSESIDSMARYKREATVLERERADSLRSLLRTHFQDLIRIGHLMPKDLIHAYDERAYDVNEQFLSNCRAFIEMEAQLRIQAEENVDRTRSAINQLSLGVAISHRGRSALPWSHKEQSLTRRSHSAIGDESRVMSDPPISNILENVEKLDECVSRLVQAYKVAVLRVFTDFSGKLTNLEKDLGSHPLLTGENQPINHLAHFQETLANTTNRLSSIINKKQLATRDMIEVTGNHLITIQKSLGALGQSLQDTYKILHDAGHLWDNHILRQGHAQRLTIAAVEDLITSNDATELANEITYNISLEQLRRSPSILQLKSDYENLVTLLESTSDMYRVHSGIELGRLEEFMNLPTLLAKILLSEIDSFLEKYQRSKNFSENPDDTKDWNVRTRNLSSNYSLGANGNNCSFPRAILQTELQQVSLSNWRNGFLESFASNYMLVPEELHRQARMWVEERSSPLQMRFSLKMVSYSIRAERVKAAQATRLAELQNHKIRLAEHLQAIQECITILPLEIAEYGSIDDSRFLYPLRQWIERMKVDIDELLLKDPLDPELKRLKMMSYALRLARHRQLFEESLNAAFEAYKLQLEYRIQNVRVSNVRFMSLIKINHEGGRYSAYEATKVCNSLVAAANALESSVDITQAVNSRKMTILDAVDHLMSPLIAIVGEVKTGKGSKNTKTHKSGKK